MTDAWKEVAGQFAQMGLPLLGRLLGGAIPVIGALGGASFGEMAGKLVAQAVAAALGVKATPEAISAAVKDGDTAEVVAKMRAIEAEAVAKWPELAKIEQSNSVAEVEVAKINAQASAEMRKEVVTNGFWSSLYRPVLMYAATANLIVFGALFFWGLVANAPLWQRLVDGYLIVSWWLGISGVILGWHFTTRGQERRAALTEAPK